MVYNDVNYCSRKEEVLNQKMILNWKVCLPLIGIIAFLIPQVVGAIGVSPPVIEIPNLLRDSSQTKVISVSRGSEDQGEVTYTVRIRGEYAHYISGPEKVVIPAGKDLAQYSFEVNAKEAALGNYEVLIDFLRVPVGLDTGSVEEGDKAGAYVTVVTGATATVKFTVTDEQILEYKLVSFQVRDTETDKPLFIKYSIDNTGNVEWKPSKIELFFTDVLDDTKKSTLEILNKDIPIVKPGERKEMVTDLPHDLLEGAYIGQVKFYYKDELVGELSSQQFKVYPPGTLRQAGELVSLTTNKSEYKTGEKIKLEAVFKNTGEIPVKALLITEIYKGDELKDLLRGEEIIIDKGEETTLPQIIELVKSGEYTLSAHVEYGNRKTETKSVEILAKGSISLLSSVVILALVIVIIFAGVFIYKRAKRKKRDLQCPDINKKKDEV